MKKTCRMMTVLLALALLTAVVLPGAAMAGNSYTPVQGGTTTFTKYLVMETDAHVPNATFKFTVAPGTAIPAEAGKMEVLAGIGTPTIADVSFAEGNDTTAGTPTDTADTTHKYAQQTATITFGTDCMFPEPGIYRYTVTETATTNLGITNDETATRTLDVYVTNKADGTLQVESYVLHTGTAAPAAGTSNGSADVGTAGAALEDKSAGYTNTYDTSNLTFKKQVSGNQASYDKYFKFTVTISGAVAGTKYTVDLSNADESISANPNAATKGITEAVRQPAELTVGTDGTVEQVYYLQHDQYITIKGLAKGTDYKVEEDPEDYKSDKTGNKVEGAIASADVTETFTNTRDGVVPTGVALSLLPGMGLLITAAAGAALLRKKSRD